MTELPLPIVESHLRWRQARLEALQAPDGWLALVDLVWLDTGRYRIGADAGADLSVPHAPDHWGTLVVDGAQAVWLDHSTGTAQTLLTDRDGTPTVIRNGRASFFLIERDNGLGLRVRDEQAASRMGFTGIDCFDFDPRWIVSAHWDGEYARFQLDGAEYSLCPQNPGADPLQFVIADRTSGRESYGGGRFLFVAAPRGTTLVLDFNRAINPPCAFTPFAVCPLPPAGNRLAVAIAAGEKTYR